MGKRVGECVGVTVGMYHRVLEGKLINTAVTAPGAAIALGLMYLRWVHTPIHLSVYICMSVYVCRTRNADMVGKLEVPGTVYTLDHLLPDLLLFRCVAKCLILWEPEPGSGVGVQPSEEWIQGCVPQVSTAPGGWDNACQV